MTAGYPTENGGEIFNDYENNKILNNTDWKYYAHAEGCQTSAGWKSHAEGHLTLANNTSHAEGKLTKALGKGSHAEGYGEEGKVLKGEIDGDIIFSSIGTANDININDTGFIVNLEYDMLSRFLSEGDIISLKPTESMKANFTGFKDTDSKKITGIYPVTGNLSASEIILDAPFKDANYYEGHNCPENGILPAGMILAKSIFNVASGIGSHVEGFATKASGAAAHAEGIRTNASNEGSHAEGNSTTAYGNYSHAEGSRTNASGNQSHAEGIWTIAASESQHTQGKYNIEDKNNKYAHIVGNGTSTSKRSNAHTLDWDGNAWFAGDVYIGGIGQDDESAEKLVKSSELNAEINACRSYAEQKINDLINGAPEALDTLNELAAALNEDANFATAITNELTDIKTNSVGVKGTGLNSEIFNNANIASGDYSHAEGLNTKSYSIAGHTEGHKTQAGVNPNSPEISATDTSCAHAEGSNTKAHAYASHAEGDGTTASGSRSHAEGYNSTSSGSVSHAEGNETTAFGNYSHAEGEKSIASGSRSHAEGASTTASGFAAHSEGNETTASGNYSHAEGLITTASGNQSHAEGWRTKAAGDNQHVQGKCNIEDTANKYAHIVGNGTSDANRSNAHTLDWDGNAWFKGDVYVGGIQQNEGIKLSKEGHTHNTNDILGLAALSGINFVLLASNASLEGTNSAITINNVANYKAFMIYGQTNATNTNGASNPYMHAFVIKAFIEGSAKSFCLGGSASDSKFFSAIVNNNILTLKGENYEGDGAVKDTIQVYGIK